jgi:hypothetical protein
MDAPRGRYRIEEKDGRLVVIDTATGAPASSVSTPAPPSPRPRAGHGPEAPARPQGLLDRYGRLLLALVVDRWDGNGRAVVKWEWEQNGRPRRWDAILEAPEQKRLGRSLAAVTAFPIAILLFIFAGSGLAWPILPFALAAVFWGVWSIVRLQRQTGSDG